MDIAAVEFNSIEVGQEAAFNFVVTDETVKNFASLSGDVSPLHVDPSYAVLTEFKQPVAHGMIIGALFSALVGTRLPGKYGLYLSQNIEFHKPVFFGTELKIIGLVEQKVEALQVIKIKTTAVALEKNVVVASGYALVKLLK